MIWPKLNRKSTDIQKPTKTRALGEGVVPVPQNTQQEAEAAGDELVLRVLALLDEHRPLHVSLVGGDPLVRYREIEKLIPQIEARGIHTQIVTSAFR